MATQRHNLIRVSHLALLQVRAHAVEVLGRAGDEELCQYLLQLVQALRYEAAADSRLSRFLVSRAAGNPVMGIRLHWYLYTEFQDPIFGSRASAVHGAFQAATTVRAEGFGPFLGAIRLLNHSPNRNQEAIPCDSNPAVSDCRKCARVLMPSQC